MNERLQRILGKHNEQDPSPLLGPKRLVGGHPQQRSASEDVASLREHRSSQRLRKLLILGVSLWGNRCTAGGFVWPLCFGGSVLASFLLAFLVVCFGGLLRRGWWFGKLGRDLVLIRAFCGSAVVFWVCLERFVMVLVWWIGSGRFGVCLMALFCLTSSLCLSLSGHMLTTPCIRLHRLVNRQKLSSEIDWTFEIFSFHIMIWMRLVFFTYNQSKSCISFILYRCYEDHQIVMSRNQNRQVVLLSPPNAAVWQHKCSRTQRYPTWEGADLRPKANETHGPSPGNSKLGVCLVSRVLNRKKTPNNRFFGNYLVLGTTAKINYSPSF